MLAEGIFLSSRAAGAGGADCPRFGVVGGAGCVEELPVAAAGYGGVSWVCCGKALRDGAE